MSQLTAEKIRELLDYNPETGVFRWKVRPRQRKLSRECAGCFDKRDGYVRIKVGGKLHLSHRLAWLYVYGEWPKGQIDHINLDRSDNRIGNLREATQSQNIANTRARSNNKLGIKGVAKHGRKFSAHISVNGKKKHLGVFDTAQQASAAFAAAADGIHGEFARSS